MSCIYCAGSASSGGMGPCPVCGEPAATLVLDVDPHEGRQEAVRRELADRFQVEAVTARSSRSTICAAREVESGRRVALRVLGRPPLPDAELEERLRGAIATAALDHPHIVTIYRFGATDSLVWYSMQLVEGRSLAAELAASGLLPLDAGLRIAGQVASALDCAHRRGVVHGDVRPANVLLDAQDQALVTDLVIGRLLDLELGTEAGNAGPSAYVAPELSSGEPPTARGDQYALAVTIHQCLTGAPPLAGAPPDRWAAGRLRRPDLPAGVADALERALQPRPEDRFPSVADFAAALHLASAGRAAGPTAPRRMGAPQKPQPVLLLDELPRGRRWMGIAVAAVLAGVGGLTVAARPGPQPGPPPLALVSPEPVAPSDVLAALPPLEPFRESPAPPAPPPAQPLAKPAPATRPAAPRATPTPGRLFISSRPWGRVYVDGEFVGNTPLPGQPLRPGVRTVRVVREGYEPFEQRVIVAPGQPVRLVDLVLQDLR